MSDFDNLTGKQQRFIVEYLKDFNATRSALVAGYSKKTAYSQGQRLLKNVEIQKMLAEKTKKIIEDADNDLKKVVNLHKTIAFVDITKTYENGISLSPDELPKEIKLALKDFQPYTKDGETFWKYTFWDKNKAADALSKYHGLYELDNKQKGDGEIIKGLTTVAQQLSLKYSKKE